MGDDLTEALNAFLARYETELIGLRRDLHAHPEPADAERRTTRLVADRLAEAGLRPVLLQGSTGLYVDIGPGGSRVALRPGSRCRCHPAGTVGAGEQFAAPGKQ